MAAIFSDSALTRAITRSGWRIYAAPFLSFCPRCASTAMAMALSRCDMVDLTTQLILFGRFRQVRPRAVGAVYYFTFVSTAEFWETKKTARARGMGFPLCVSNPFEIRCASVSCIGSLRQNNHGYARPPSRARYPPD